MRTSTTALLPRLAAVACVLALCAPAQAQWKWRDKDGQITASDRPPPRDVPDKDILSRPNESRRAPPAAAAAASDAASAAPAAAAKAQTPLDRELDARKRAAEQEQTTKTKLEEEKQAQTRAENCRRARSQQVALDQGQRIARINDKGEREVLDDKGRAEEQRRAREVIASDCR